MDEKLQPNFWAGSEDMEVLRSTKPTPRSSSKGWKLALGALLLLSIAAFNARKYMFAKGSCMRPSEYKPQCPAQEVIGPKSYPEITERNVEKLFKSDEFKKLSVERLSGAVQIPTEDFDDMGNVGEDERWEVFYDLEKYFKDTFPLVHEKLDLEIVNSHALVYNWRGTDSSLQPILLTGHQDVAMEIFPFSGYFDGKYINGRGALDCKNNVLAIFSSITALLEADFTPRRTVVLAFGFDEEAPAGRGAGHIAKHLENVWGQDSFAILIDEGIFGIQHVYGRTFGIPQASEKGCMDMVIRVHVPGGQSSMAPPHTSIGIISEAITLLESKARINFPSRFLSNNPFYYQLHCAAEDNHTDMSNDLRKALKKSNENEEIVYLLANDFGSDILLRTSQAATIFNSGSKSNALPQFATAYVNYRISNEQSVSEVQTALINTLSPIASKHNLHFLTREEADNNTSSLPEGTLSLSWLRSLELSLVSTHKSSSWKYFSGVIKHVFDEEGEGRDVLVAPTIAQGNTDTKYYWGLTGQIYRFGPVRSWHDEGWGGVHDVNERISIDANLESILFYHEFIRVFDEADLGE